MIFIMAGGKQERWKANYPKQLAKIGDTTLLERTLSQLSGKEVTVITADSRVASLGPASSKREIHKYLAGTIQSLRPKWGPRAVILLGDVYFTPQAMESILSYDGPCMFFGWQYEMFAISFTDKDGIEIACKAAKFHARHGGGDGKVCRVYRAYNHQDLNQHFLGENYTPLGDGTCDIDTVEQYQDLLERIK